MEWRRLLTSIVAVMVVAGACGGDSDPIDSTARPTTTTATTAPPETTTTKPAPTTTASTTTTTTTSAPTTTAAPDGSVVVADLNAAMRRAPDYLASGNGIVAEPGANLPDEALFSQRVIGGGTPGGNGWRLASVTVDTDGFSGEFILQRRMVDGVVYEQDPAGGVWEIDEENAPDPIEDALNGTLALSGPEAQLAGGVITVVGGYPADPAVDEVRVEIDQATSLLLSIGITETVPRDDFAGFVTPEGPDLISTILVRVASYSFDVAPVTAPPVGMAMRVVPRREASFFTLMPAEWQQMAAADIDIIGVTDAYEGPEGLLLILVEDLAGTTITDLPGYVEVIEDVLFAGFTIESSLQITTLQGADAWVISGIETSGLAFRRLAYLSPTDVAVNLTFLQNLDAETGEPSPIWAESQALVEFMINSLLVFRPDGSL